MAMGIAESTAMKARNLGEQRQERAMADRECVKFELVDLQT